MILVLGIFNNPDFNKCFINIYWYVNDWWNALKSLYWQTTIEDTLLKIKVLKRFFKRCHRTGISNPAPEELPSCRLQFQPCCNTPVCNYQVALNTLISWIRCVWLGLELKSSDGSSPGAGLETHAIEEPFLVPQRTIQSKNHLFLTFL